MTKVFTNFQYSLIYRSQLYIELKSMGSGPSINQSPMNLQYDQYQPFFADDIPECYDIQKKTESDFGFNAIWSVRPLDSVSPINRTGYISAYDPENDCAYIGYGCTESKQHIVDLWRLDMKTRRWKEIQIENNKVTPRAGARAVLVGNFLWVFGGFYNKQYLGDLHCINLLTGAIVHPQTTGQGPKNCSGHSMNYVNGKIVIFGGYNNGSIEQCCILDLRTMAWTSIETKLTKFSHASTVYNNEVYLYGGSKTNAMIKINPQTKEIFSLASFGHFPSYTMTKSSMVTVGKYIVQIGGVAKAGQQFSAIRVYDIERGLWSKLPISPDNTSTLLCDGEIDQDGYFNLPSCYDVTLVYREQEREIVALEGKPFNNPPYLAVLSLGEATPELNLHSDLLSMLNSF